MSEITLQKIIHVLEENNITYKHLTHEKIPPNSIGAATIRGTPLEKGAKALILKTKEGKFFQVIIPAHRKANLKVVKKTIGVKNVSLASPDEVLALTDCIVGSVPPFGSLWNIPVYADNMLLEKEVVVFSSGTLEDSMQINPEDLITLNKAQVGNFSKSMEE